MSPRLPGGVLGILGGGQLGRLTAIAARQLGLRVVVLDPSPDCSAAALADTLIVAPFDDAEAAARLAELADVVTLEIETIGPEAARAVSKHAPLRPRVEILEMIQNRAVQRGWLRDQGLPQGPWRAAVGVEAIAAAAEELGRPCRVKAAQGGYDGRGQARLATPADAGAVFAALGGAPAVVEQELELEAELSVLVARSPSGEVRTHPVSRNWHVDAILDVCHIPSGLPDALETEASALAARIAEASRLEGILAVEMFVVGGKLLVNEMAPRPHNTFHTTTHATQVSQFEQLVRAVCDLPLGSTAVVQPVALANLLGDLWLRDESPDTSAVLAMEGLHLFLYGKQARPKRKVGHLLATGHTSAVALQRVRAGREALERPD